MATIHNRLSALEAAKNVKLAGAELLASKWAALARQYPHLLKPRNSDGNPG